MTEKKDTNNPRKIFELVQSMFVTKDFSSFSDLIAMDAVLELPFSPQKSNRLIQGRENILAYLAGVAKKQTPLRPTGYKSMTIYDTNDPEVIIAEFDMCGEVIATGLPYQLSYIDIFKVHNGQIINLRDYWNPLGTPEILGSLPELFTMLTQK
jgi:uncharacterized protein